jgi:hypothetical protein
MTQIDDVRIRRFLQNESGLDLEHLPTSGIDLYESSARSDSFDNRMRIFRVGNAALATGTPEVIGAIEPLLVKITVWELFSPVGRYALERILDPYPVRLGFDYVLADKSMLHMPKLDSATTPVHLPSLPHDLPNRKQLPHPRPGHDAIEAYGMYCDQKLVATSGFYCRTADVVGVTVSTDDSYRERGFGTAVVAALTKWILEHDAVAHYAALSSNIPSLLLARRLGYGLAWQTLGA